MAGFEVVRGRLGVHDTVEALHRRAGVHVVVSTCGATLLHWVQGDGRDRFDLLDGYVGAAEFTSQDGVRNGIMAPFSNRIAGGRYEFGGRRHDLLPGVPAAERLIYHGFVRTLPFRLTRAAADEDAAVMSFTTSALRPGSFPGYPFAIDVTVDYRIHRRGFDVSITGHNVGTGDAPYSSGWHPYFRLGPHGIDNLTLQVPARRVVVTDESLIPLPGLDALVALEARPCLDLRSPRPLAGMVLDVSYADLQPDPDGRSRTTLHDPASGRSLTVWQERGLMHVFTGDTLARDRRCSVALEPVEVPTNAFNRPEDADAALLRPGESRTFSFGVSTAP